MDAAGINAHFFKQLKEKLPQHQSLVDVVADELSVSTDSAYRRIRGEKALAFDEMILLASRYQVSIDQFVDMPGNSHHFTGTFISRDKPDLANYIQRLIVQLQQINGAEQKHMLYFNKDIPLFHHFLFPELAAFKCYFWSRYNLNYPEYNKGRFLISDFVELFTEKGKEIAALYQAIPSTEIWNLDCINTTIRQIDYYRESNIFESNEDIDVLYTCMDKLADHLEQQAEAGYKSAIGEKNKGAVSYQVYVNEFILGDNTILVECDGQRSVFLNHNVINYIVTAEPAITDYTYATLQTILQKSTLISGTGEKTRQLFFNSLRERIHQKKKLV